MAIQTVEEQYPDAAGAGSVEEEFEFMDPWAKSTDWVGDYGFLGTPSVDQTFEGRPSDLWRTARLGQLGYRAAMPQFQRAAMSGFRPAFGRYLLAGSNQPFSQFLRGTSTGGGTSPLASQTNLADQWAGAVAASRRLGTDPSAMESQMSPEAYGRELQYRGLLGSDNARANSIAMAMAGMGVPDQTDSPFGGGWSGGYGGAARQRAIGNLYDLHAARAAAAGTPAGGFLNWINRRMTPAT